MLSQDQLLEWQKSEDKPFDMNNDSILGIYEQCVNDCVKSGKGYVKYFMLQIRKIQYHNRPCFNCNQPKFSIHICPS